MPCLLVKRTLRPEDHGEVIFAVKSTYLEKNNGGHESMDAMGLYGRACADLVILCQRRTGVWRVATIEGS